jgi:hypothetical protein
LLLWFKGGERFHNAPLRVAQEGEKSSSTRVYFHQHTPELESEFFGKAKRRCTAH